MDIFMMPIAAYVMCLIGFITVIVGGLIATKSSKKGSQVAMLGMLIVFGGAVSAVTTIFVASNLAP